MASSLVCKKRVKHSKPIIPSPPRTTFESLPKKIMAKILNKLSKEELSSTLCSSKSLREKLIVTCLPLMKPLPLDYHGLLLQFDTRPGLCIGFDRSTPGDCPMFDHYTHQRTCARIMHCNEITADMLLDCCNGLLLFCNDGNNVSTLLNDSFYYYVINPITKQCIAVLKPYPKSSRSMYAALAYDPTESSFFKIIQFQGSCQLNIFHSEKGVWQKMKPKLPQEVKKAPWETKPIYNKGALFRVTQYGHLVKFLVGDPKGDQAMVINLPSLYMPESKCTLGVKDGKILFALISDSSLLIWELKDEEKYEEEEKYWNLLNVVECDDFHSVDSDGHILGIHPYRDVVFMLEQPFIYCVDYSTKEVIYRSYSYPPDGQVNAFPVLKCSLPFACSLKKKDSNTFQHLNISTAPRMKERYRASRIRASNYWPSG